MLALIRRIAASGNEIVRAKEMCAYFKQQKKILSISVGYLSFQIYPDKFSVTEAHIKVHDIIRVCTKSECDKLRHRVYMGNIISRGISSVA